MNKNISIKAIDKSNLTEQTQFGLSVIMEIENYFYQEINQRIFYSKKLSKYVTLFDYTDKILNVVCKTSGGVSIILLTSIIGVPIGIASTSFNRNNLKVIKYNKNEKEKA